MDINYKEEKVLLNFERLTGRSAFSNQRGLKVAGYIWLNGTFFF